jgi:hypothetical protein
MFQRAVEDDVFFNNLLEKASSQCLNSKMLWNIRKPMVALGDTLVTLGFISAFELKQFFNVIPVVPLKAEQTGLSISILIELILKQAHSEGGTYS